MKTLKINVLKRKEFEEKYPNWKVKENGNYINLPRELFIVKNNFCCSCIDNRPGKVKFYSTISMKIIIENLFYEMR